MSKIEVISEFQSKQIIWKITNFSLFDDEDCEYYSSSFSFADKNWFLVIYPNGNKNKNSVGYISLYLKKKSDCEMKLDFYLGLKTLDGENKPKHHRLKIFSKEHNGYGVDKCILRSKLFERKPQYLPNDVLTVFCHLYYPEYSKIPKEVGTHKPLKILQDFEQLYLEKKNTDVVFTVKGVDIPAHRAILAARSTVFESTFRNDMTEKLTGIVNVEDFDSSIFSNFLHFLYSGDVSIISLQNVTGLFTASDKYDVADLRAECITFMKENITVENFCEIMKLALQHTEIDLVNLSSSFFIKNAEKITETVNWQLFVKQNPTESNELFIKFIKAVPKP